MTSLIQLLVSLLAIYLVYVLGFMIWVETQSRGDRYFARPLGERRQFVRLLRAHARYICPMFEIISRLIRLKKIPAFKYQGVSGPLMMMSKKSFARTKQYSPQPEDIFIATQMKCGTTWMQQIVFEILCKGDGDLSDQGFRHMYALSPWIETSPNASVPMKRAPLVGERQNRIIKTHMPAQLIPHSDLSKYIYVTRHPVSCFASCVDFIHLLAGPLAPKREDLLDLYCSDEMWWMSWPDHVESWWQRSQQYSNVLFVHYEDLKRDLPAMLKSIAKFMNVDLSPAQLEKIAFKSSFEYMKEHEAHFEMFSPNVFSVSQESIRFMQSGSLDRFNDTKDFERARINTFCNSKLANAKYPLAEFYPDVCESSNS